MRKPYGGCDWPRRRGNFTGIALDAGYDSRQAFARAFRDFVGISPRDYQARHGGIAASPLIEIVEVAPTDVLCLGHEGPVASIGLTYRKLFALLEGTCASPDRSTQIGISTGDPEGGDFIYR